MKKSIHSPEQVILQKILKDLRQENGLTQNDLADRLAKSQSFVSKYESGERRLDLTELREICKSIGIELVELIKRFEKSLKS